MNKIFSLSSRMFLALVMIVSQLFQGMMYINPLWVQEVFAQSSSGYDLIINKTVIDDSNSTPWWTITYRIEYANTSGDALTDITLEDTRWSGLGNPMLITSDPNLSWLLMFNTGSNMFTVTGISLGENQTWFLDMQFTIDAAMVSGDSIINTVSWHTNLEICKALA